MAMAYADGEWLVFVFLVERIPHDLGVIARSGNGG